MMNLQDSLPFLNAPFRRIKRCEGERKETNPKHPAVCGQTPLGTMLPMLKTKVAWTLIARCTQRFALSQQNRCCWGYVRPSGRKRTGVMSVNAKKGGCRCWATTTKTPRRRRSVQELRLGGVLKHCRLRTAECKIKSRVHLALYFFYGLYRGYQSEAPKAASVGDGSGSLCCSCCQHERWNQPPKRR